MRLSFFMAEQVDGFYSLLRELDPNRCSKEVKVCVIAGIVVL